MLNVKLSEPRSMLTCTMPQFLSLVTPKATLKISQKITLLFTRREGHCIRAH
jgi:hypothetical protein